MALPVDVERWRGSADVRVTSAASSFPRALASLALALLVVLAHLAMPTPQTAPPTASACSCGPACRCAVCGQGTCGCVVQSSAPQALAASASHHEFLPPALPCLQEVLGLDPARRAFPRLHNLLPTAHRDRLLRPPRPLPVA